jgi:hypothetical protein
MRCPLLAVVALLALIRPAAAFAAQTKTAKGTVAAIDANSMTIRAGLTEMRFAVDDRTAVEAPGAGAKSRRAHWNNAKGPKLGDLIKTGQHVEVGYRDEGGAFHADTVRRVSSAAPAMITKSSGVVASLSGDSLTIRGSGGYDATFTQTFVIDSRTQVVGRGIGTHASATGGKASFLEVVGLGDRVSVSYHEVAGSLHASDVRVTRKSAR